MLFLGGVCARPMAFFLAQPISIRVILVGVAGVFGGNLRGRFLKNMCVCVV